MIGRQPMAGWRSAHTACMGSEVRHRYACMHMYSTATSIYTHLVMSVVIPFALIQINEHNRRHYPGAAAAVLPTPMVSGVNCLTRPVQCTSI